MPAIAANLESSSESDELLVSDREGPEDASVSEARETHDSDEVSEVGVAGEAGELDEDSEIDYHEVEMPEGEARQDSEDPIKN